MSFTIHQKLIFAARGRNLRLVEERIAEGADIDFLRICARVELVAAFCDPPVRRCAAEPVLFCQAFRGDEVEGVCADSAGRVFLRDGAYRDDLDRRGLNLQGCLAGGVLRSFELRVLS